MLNQHIKVDGKPDKAKIYKVLADYEKHLEHTEKHLKIKGKTLAEANKEHASHHYYYNLKKIEIKTVCDYLEKYLDSIRGRLYVKYNEKNSRSLTHTQIDRYIDKDEEYLEWYEVYLAVKESKETFTAVVDAFNSRGFALKNITSAIIANVQESVL
jgi:hypothetical protein